MTPRDKFSNSDGLPQEATEPSMALETVATEESEQEVEEWAQSEGYTPLAELLGGGGGGAMFMAVPPESDGPTYTFQASTEGMFFADINSFISEQDLLSPSEEVQTEQAEELNFRVLADQALKALDEDYTMTLSGVDVEKERENRTQSTTLATIDQEPLAEDTEGERTDSVDHSIEEDGAIDSKPAPSVVAALPKFEPSPTPAEIDTAAIQRAVASIQATEGCQTIAALPRVAADFATRSTRHCSISATHCISKKNCKGATGNFQSVTFRHHCSCPTSITDTAAETQAPVAAYVGRRSCRDQFGGSDSGHLWSASTLARGIPYFAGIHRDYTDRPKCRATANCRFAAEHADPAQESHSHLPFGCLP